MERGGAHGLGGALEWLYGTQLFGVKLGLDGMRRLAGALGVALGGEAAPRFIHVAGTNGKGSTCALVESVCRASGLRTGLYTSPHLVSLRERFRLNGELISETELCDALHRIRKLVSEWEPHPTFFEIVTVLALEWFQRKEAECVVLETGMGGRLDATNVVTPVVSVLTPVGLDHQQYLGTTLAQIAAEKAGILKPGVPAVSAPQSQEVLAVFERVALEKGSSLRVVSAPWSDGPVGLAGTVQRWNASLAVAALMAAGLEPGAPALRSGLAQVHWPGRFQRLAADLIVDGAHNPAAAAALVETWREVFPGEKAAVIFGALQDKDAREVLRLLAPIAGELILVPVQSPRSFDLSQLRRLAAESVRPEGGALAVDIFEAADVASALARSTKGRRRLVAGSLYLVGEVLALHTGTAQERSAQ
jgi:dihydrofolate synthase/folylpolyglutamate synthase